jgi:3'(2'), 5'-bisphosphate nucleotidase
VKTPLLDQLAAIALDACAALLQFQPADVEVAYKSPGDPITEADRAVNTLICSRLEELYPGIPIVAEESQPERFAGFADADRVFFVDPLDGTREFLANRGEFAVLIGVTDDGVATHGVVAAPTRGRLWAGRVGSGAFVQAADGSRARINASGRDQLRHARLLVSHSTQDSAIARARALLGPEDVVRVGSAGLKGAMVAEGSGDVYVSPGRAGKRWDACAIDALVQAAGGQFSDADGDPIDYRSDDLSNSRGLLATNGALHATMVEHIRALRGRRAGV